MSLIYTPPPPLTPLIITLAITDCRLYFAIFFFFFAFHAARHTFIFFTPSLIAVPRVRYYASATSYFRCCHFFLRFLRYDDVLLRYIYLRYRHHHSLFRYAVLFYRRDIAVFRYFIAAAIFYFAAMLLPLNNAANASDLFLRWMLAFRRYYRH